LPIDTVFLDAGGVLIYPNWTRIAETLGRHGVAVSAERLRAADPAARYAVDTRTTVAATNDADRGSAYFRRMFEGAGLRPSPEIEMALGELYDYHSEHNLWEYLPDDVLPALQRLRALGLKLAVASNANGVLHRVLERVGLTPFFHTICDSCVEGVEKPDAAFFHLLLSRAGSRPETTIHVGDLYYVDVEGARAAGITPVLLDPYGLYDDFDVIRVASLGELVDRLEHAPASLMPGAGEKDPV
jgi:putative hydrolase of the HAD superfamily